MNAGRRSLVLAIELLKVKMVIVVHHTDCGAQVRLLIL